MKNSVLHIAYKGCEIPVVIGNNDWDQYADFPYNVQHHLLSLRWLAKLSAEDAVRVLVDFVSFFSKVDSKNNFYLGKHADHTSVIRISVLKKYYYSNISRDHKQLLMEELLKTSNSIISGETYNFGTNHALMSDVEILRNYSLLGIRKEDVKKVSERLFKNLNFVFDVEVGSTKEHSISYQEFNLNIIYKIQRVLNDLGPELFDIDKFNQFKLLVEKVKEFSRYLLYASYVPGRGYLPLGDSFEAYKEGVLREIFGVSSPEELLNRVEPIVFFSSSFGVYIYKSKDCVFSFKNSFHSMVHKQNDDLGITLNLFGFPVFIDGGHHDIMTKQLSLKGVQCHSIPIIDNLKLKNDLSLCAESYLAMKNSGLIASGGHKRFSGALLSREIELKDNALFIRDSVEDESSVVSSHFVISPFVETLTVSKGSVVMKIKDYEIDVKHDGHLVLGKTKVVFNEKEVEVDKLIISSKEVSNIVVTLPEQVVFFSDSDIVCDSFFRSMSIS